MGRASRGSDRSRQPVERVARVAAGTVLLVEDDDLVRELVAEIVRAQGFAVVAVADAEAAVVVARREPVRLLLTDVMLPGMDGATLTRRVVELHPAVCCVWMSGYPPDAVPWAGAAPGRVFLRKPFTPRELARTLHEALG